MDVHEEVKKIRPSIGSLIAGVARFAILSLAVVGYFRYIEDEPSGSMPAIVACIACLAFASLGKLRADLRYRILLGRLLRRIDKTG